jgi:hypothetical protein
LGDVFEVGRPVQREIGALGEVLAQQPIRAVLSNEAKNLTLARVQPSESVGLS